MSFTASDVLLKAASRIEEEGMWCQGELFNGKAACALGAISEAARILAVHHFTETHAGRIFDDYLDTHELVPPRTYAEYAEDDLRAAARFNDAPGRTAHEVAEAMRQAALQ